MSEWISVKDRLPEADESVLIQYGHSKMVAYHKVDSYVYEDDYKDLNDTGWYDDHDEFICSSYEVAAWMPLPSLYEGE